MSGLMVSLAVVVVAILATLFLVFSDQPATEQLRRLRAGHRPSSRGPTSSGAGKFPAQPAMAHRGPPPPGVLQHQLALPATRPRPAAPGGPGPVQLVTPLRHAPAASTAASAETAATGIADATPEPTSALAVAEVEEDAGPEAYTWHEDRPVLRRARSTVALVVVLTFVGAAVALLVGIALALAGLAIHQTVG